MHKKSKPRNSFSASHRQAAVQQFPGKQGSITHDGYLGRQMPSPWTSLPSFFPWLYMLSVTPYGMEYPFGQLGSGVPAVSPTSSLCTPSLLPVGRGEEQWSPWLNAQQWLKHPSIINTVFSTKPKHSRIRATAKKINSTAAKTSTGGEREIRRKLHSVVIPSNPDKGETEVSRHETSFN